MYISYREYIEQTSGIVSETYLQEMNERVIFGTDDENYTFSDMKDITQSDWESKAKKMHEIMQQIGFNEHKIITTFSDIYEGEQRDEYYVYSSEYKTIKAEPLTQTYKQYHIKYIDGDYIIDGVLSDRMTFGSDYSDEENKERVQALQYQTHEGKPVEFTQGEITFVGK